MSKLNMWIPPIVKNFKKRINSSNAIYYFDRFLSWEDALTESRKYGGDYSSDRILKQVIEATQLVRQGEASYEQDGVCFYEENNNYELLAAMLYANSLLKNETLNVLDFGGALGSTFFRYRKIWESVGARWSVVEQPHFVSYGKENIHEIDFYYNAKDSFKVEQKPNVLLLSSVVMYLDNPYTDLEKILENEFEYIVIDETAFLPDVNDKMTIMLQHVPERIYKAVYPLHILGLNEFKKKIEALGYRIVWEWDYAGGNIPIKKRFRFENTIEKGFLLARK